MPRNPKPADEKAKSDGTSKRRFLVIVGIDYGTGYKAPGSIVDDIPAASVPQSLAEGVIVPEGEDLPDDIVPVTEQCSRMLIEAPAAPAPLDIEPDEES